MPEIEFTKILEDLSLTKFFQKDLYWSFHNTHCKKNCSLFSDTFWRPTPNSSVSWMNISISLHRKWVVYQKINFLTLCSIIRLVISAVKCQDIVESIWEKQKESWCICIYICIFWSLYLHNILKLSFVYANTIPTLIAKDSFTDILVLFIPSFSHALFYHFFSDFFYVEWFAFMLLHYFSVLLPLHFLFMQCNLKDKNLDFVLF